MRYAVQCSPLFSNWQQSDGGDARGKFVSGAKVFAAVPSALQPF